MVLDLNPGSQSTRVTVSLSVLKELSQVDICQIRLDLIRVVCVRDTLLVARLDGAAITPLASDLNCLVASRNPSGHTLWVFSSKPELEGEEGLVVWPILIHGAPRVGPEMARVSRAAHVILQLGDEGVGPTVCQGSIELSNTSL